MSNFSQRDYQRRKLFGLLEERRLQYKCAIRDLSIPAHMRAFYVQRLNKYSRASSLTRFRNRCVLTGRGRGVDRFCKLSRIKLRELACQGWLQGVYKSSW